MGSVCVDTALKAHMCFKLIPCASSVCSFRALPCASTSFRALLTLTKFEAFFSSHDEAWEISQRLADKSANLDPILLLSFSADSFAVAAEFSASQARKTTTESR